MQTPNAYRFRLYTCESVGAYTTAYGQTQAQAQADLVKQLAPWELTAPLHGPSRSPHWFD